MNSLEDITDDEFVPFLHSIGVETYKKSFEWMLSDSNFSGVLQWLYNNLDHNNALSAREEYRYKEIEKKGQLLLDEDLEASIVTLQEQYQGISLPGDQHAKEDVKLDIKMRKERLNLLTKQEEIMRDVIKCNQDSKQGLSLEITKLNSAHQQLTEDESAAADECLRLADEVDNVTEEVIAGIADALTVYSECHADKEIAKKFFTFGPLEAYRQSQALFRSHFDLYTSKKFGKTHKDNISDDETRSALIEAKNMEERLTDAICAYVESKAELCGEQAKVALVANYSNVHPSQIPIHTVEAQSAIQLLEQEESILDQQLQSAVKELVDSRSRLAIETTARAALAVRERVHNDLTYLLDTTHQALSLDRLLYCALRHELRTLEEFLQFAAHLRQYVMEENDAVAYRIECMNQICEEQDQCEERLQSSDYLLQTLCSVLGVQPTNDPVQIVKYYTDVHKSIEELKDNVQEGYEEREDALVAFNKSTSQLKSYIWDGCTKQPNCWDPAVSALLHSLKQDMTRLHNTVIDACSQMTNVKNSDKYNLRKLWQWFLTDPQKLIAAIKDVQTKRY